MPAHFSDWQAYPWKNEIALQLDRILIHGREIGDDGFSGPHNPFHMFERAFVIAAFCIRRMIEKKLVTDAFADRNLEVRTFPAPSRAKFRTPFKRSSGGSFYANYEITNPTLRSLKPKGLADEIIHSSQLMVITGDPTISNGILIVSDWHLKKRIIHLTFGEFEIFVRSVLEDEIVTASDSWDVTTGEVSATRA